MEDDKNVQIFIDDFPSADVQQLRTTVRNARKEREENKPPKATRQLFQMIKELIPEQGRQKNAPEDEHDEDDEA